MTPPQTPQKTAHQLNLPLLIVVVITSMIGGGAFNLPQNMAAGASLGPIIIAWIITLIGMGFLANTFRILADQRPDLKAGIYAYAHEGFGALVGFEMAWGYWLAATFGNVAFAVLLTKTLGYFFPVFSGDARWHSMLFGSLLIWVMHFVVLFGVKRAAMLNVIATAVNLLTLTFILAVMATKAKVSLFSFDFWGKHTPLGSVWRQMENTMLMTLWVFIGIEGAVVVSERAAKPSQVGAATFIGLGICAVLYFLLSALPFGLMHQAELAKLSSPSAAYVMAIAVGHWGAVFVNLSLLISLSSCWLAWTILIAELPYQAAKGGVFPKFFAHENRFHSNAPSLWVSSVMMQAAMFVAMFAKDAWLWLISMTSVMILPPYLASAAYLWRYAHQRKIAPAGKNRWALMTGILGTVYALWLLMAAGLKFLLISLFLFALGWPMYWWAQRERIHEKAKGKA